MKPLFIEVIGTDNRKYRVNVAQILYFYTNEHKGTLVTEIVFTNKESLESKETTSDIEGRINQVLGGDGMAASQNRPAQPQYQS